MREPGRRGREGLIRVTGAAESAALDAAAIAAGTPGRELMRRAGTAAAKRIAFHFGALARNGVAVYAGSGNNGGDAWIVARELSRRGFTVRVRETDRPLGADAAAAREEGKREVRADEPRGDEAIIVDGLLGTGSRGAPRNAVARAIADIETARSRGARVVSLDVPSGLDATTGGAEGAVHADLTLCFATIKRGVLIARDHSGAVEVIDIGIQAPRTSALPRLVDGRFVRETVPTLSAVAHKGIRKKFVVVGGQRGMAGAAILTARGGFRAGIGMVRLCVQRDSLAPTQASIPEASAFDWPGDEGAAKSIAEWGNVMVIGPGLGDGRRDLVERMLRASKMPVVLDAEAITAFREDVGALGTLLGGRPAILTPHPAELATLIGASTSETLVRRFEAATDVARATGATVITKGTPTVVTAPDGSRLVSATGNAALAVAGSGDLLAGVAATMLAQIEDDPQAAAACAAWAHGRAAELARGMRHTIRGITLGDIEHAIADVWEHWPEPLDGDLLAQLASAGDLG